MTLPTFGASDALNSSLATHDAAARVVNPSGGTVRPFRVTVRPLETRDNKAKAAVRPWHRRQRFTLSADHEKSTASAKAAIVRTGHPRNGAPGCGSDNYTSLAFMSRTLEDSAANQRRDGVPASDSFPADALERMVRADSLRTIWGASRLNKRTLSKTTSRGTERGGRERSPSTQESVEPGGESGPQGIISARTQPRAIGGPPQ